jgi:hypothetical protein
VVSEGSVHAELHRNSGGQGDAARVASTIGKLDSERLVVDFRGLPAEPKKGVASGNVKLDLSSSGAVSQGRAASVPASDVRGATKPETKTLTASEVLFSFVPRVTAERRLEPWRLPSPWLRRPELGRESSPPAVRDGL